MTKINLKRWHLKHRQLKLNEQGFHMFITHDMMMNINIILHSSRTYIVFISTCYIQQECMSLNINCYCYCVEIQLIYTIGSIMCMVQV